MSKIWSAIVGKDIRVYLADTSEMVKEASRLHETSNVSTQAFSRALTAASLLGKLLKNKDDILTLKVSGTNQIKTILVTTDFTGRVKGYISNPHAEIIHRNRDKIGEAIGLGGNITLIRDFGLKEPYVGISHMISAEIDDDIAFYYKYSEQQPTWLKLRTLIEEEKVLAAGGILIQPMPYATDLEKKAVEVAEKNLESVVELLYQGQTAEEIIQGYFPNLDVEMTGEFSVAFKCDCSYERISKALITVGKEELQEILEVDQEAELQCHFCTKKYHFTKDDLKAMIEALDA